MTNIAISSVEEDIGFVDQKNAIPATNDMEKEVSPQSMNILWERVDQFVRSKNFGTCLQVQSLFVQDRFPDWYWHEDGEHYCPNKAEDRNKRPYFIKSLPECYTMCGDGETLYKQYQEAMMEWAYFLRSESTLHGNSPGEISRCQWPSLGKSNFLHQIKSRLRSYCLQNDDEDNIYSGARGASSYFLGYGSDARDLQVMFLKESRPQNGKTLHAKSRRKQTTTEMGQDKIQVDVRSWTTKKLGHRHKQQKTSPLAEFTSDDLLLYTQPLELNGLEVGRAARVAIAEDGGLIRVGPKIYIRDGAGDFKLLDLGYSRARYVEEACRRGPWVAMVHRRGVKLAEPEDNHPGAPQTDHSDEEQSDSDSSSDSSEEDSPDEEVQTVMQSEPGLASVDMERGWNSDSSNSARESPSSGSTTDVTDELPDDRFNDWFSEDEDMVLKDVDESSNESMATVSVVGSTLSQDADNETDAESDTSSDISLKSTISRQMWGDSDSEAERSDDEPESFTMEEPSEERFSDCRQLVIFSFNPSTEQVHRRFRFVYRWAGRLFNSPPIIHPTYALAVWPLGRNEILFADLAGSPQVTYFTRSLRTGARDICHISIQAKFSDCGQFLHLVCLDGRRDGKSGQPHDGQTKSAEALGRISQLYLRVSTYRLSKGKPARSLPRLVYKATVLLDCELLRKDGNCRLPASPLPYTITWTADHVYATESHRILRVYRLPLYRGVEERDLSQDASQQVSDEKRNTLDSDSEMDLDKPKPARVAFRNEKSIFLPNSASRRSVSFFPAPDEATGTAKVDKEDKGKAKPSSKSHKQKSEGGKVVATVVISPEDSLVNKEQLPYLGPPQVLYLTADEFGSWKRLNEDDCGAGKDCAEAWSGGQLEARYERFDNEEDCDIVPYFR
ncbi:hypothetical protein CEP54_012155 [Fusarium duplospermum]|uniref:Uncharacterized protein n=1 Tax=Fusarium duplospermum TaxID=1325734 RepID=A0A428PAB6_9HYPO|nr:hypothetical protein CEP54_012155 [Fusarium duplospermum]